MIVIGLVVEQTGRVEHVGQTAFTVVLVDKLRLVCGKVFEVVSARIRLVFQQVARVNALLFAFHVVVIGSSCLVIII